MIRRLRRVRTSEASLHITNLGFLGFRVLVDVFIEGIEVLRSSTVHVEPQIADEILLVEDGAIRTQEGVKLAIVEAHVVDLARGIRVSVDPRQEALALEGGRGNLVEGRVVLPGHSEDAVRVGVVLRGLALEVVHLWWSLRSILREGHRAQSKQEPRHGRCH